MPAGNRACFANRPLPINRVERSFRRCTATDLFLLTLLVAAVACNDPVAPAVCEPVPAIGAIIGHPIEHTISGCLGRGDYTATSSDPAVVTVGVEGNTLTVLGQAQGTAEIEVTASQSDSYLVYPVVSMSAWVGNVTVCNVEDSGDPEGYDVEINGWYSANIDVADVVATVYSERAQHGRARRVRPSVAKGRRVSFYTSGWISRDANLVPP